MMMLKHIFNKGSVYCATNDTVRFKLFSGIGLVSIHKARLTMNRYIDIMVRLIKKQGYPKT